MTQAVALAQQASTGVSQGFKNRIINGAMVIDQRNAGAAITTGGFVVDRFALPFATDGAFSAQQDSSAPAGFTNSVKCTTTTADASLSASQYWLFRQRIEGYNVADLGFGTASAKTITLSFWVRSSLTGTFSGAILNGDTNRSYPFTYAISVADTWEQKSVTIAGDTSGTWNKTNGNGMVLVLSLGIGSTYQGTANAWGGAEYYGTAGSVSVIGTLSATWYVTGVQLEVGSTATSFDYRPYGTELQLCQRYYYKFANINGVGTAWFGVATTSLSTTRSIGIPITLPVPARTTPSLSISQFSLVNTQVNTSYAVTSASVYAGYSTYGTAFSLDMTTSGISAGTVYFLYVADGGFLAYSMEL